MSQRAVTVVPGNRIVLAADPAGLASVEAYFDREKIRFREAGAAIARLEGDGLRDLVGPPAGTVRWSWLRRESVREGEAVLLTTLAAFGRTCVYVAAERGRLVLTGGASIVSRIETHDVARLLGLQDDRVL